MITLGITGFLWGWFCYDVTGGKHRYGVPLVIMGATALVLLRGAGY